MEQTIQQPVKRRKTLLYVVSALAIGGAVYGVFIYKDKNDETAYGKLTDFIRQKGMTREQAIEIINKAGSKPMVDANAYDTDYLIARAKALKSKSETFSLDGKTYNTKTGRVIK
jgi:hypothetical protein